MSNSKYIIKKALEQRWSHAYYVNLAKLNKGITAAHDLATHFHQYLFYYNTKTRLFMWGWYYTPEKYRNDNQFPKLIDLVKRVHQHGIDKKVNNMADAVIKFILTCATYKCNSNEKQLVIAIIGYITKNPYILRILENDVEYYYSIDVSEEEKNEYRKK